MTASIPARGNMAISCEYMLLTEAYETLVFCGEAIDSVNKERYVLLQNDFIKFIRMNTRSDEKKNVLDYGEARRKEFESRPKDRVCKDPGYPILRKTFYQYISDVGMAAVSELLKQPRDPNSGDCF
jgi:hypothetical protein